MLYCTSPWLFCNYQSVLFNPFTSFTQAPPPAPLATIWLLFSGSNGMPLSDAHSGTLQSSGLGNEMRRNRDRVEGCLGDEMT